MPPSRLQQWLSPRPAQRTTTAHDASVAAPEDAITYDFVRNTAGLHAVRETHHLSNKAVREGGSGPPLHIHLRQDEHFEVQQGVLGVVVNGREHAVSKGDGRISVPSGARYVGPCPAMIIIIILFVGAGAAQLYGTGVVSVRNLGTSNIHSIPTT